MHLGVFFVLGLMTWEVSARNTWATQLQRSFQKLASAKKGYRHKGSPISPARLVAAESGRYSVKDTNYRQYSPPSYSAPSPSYGYSKPKEYAPPSYKPAEYQSYKPAEYQQSYAKESCYGRPPGTSGDTAYNCRVFQVCQADGRLDKMDCPASLRFNNYLGVCDWPYKVDSYCNPIYYAYSAPPRYSNDDGHGPHVYGGSEISFVAAEPNVDRTAAVVSLRALDTRAKPVDDGKLKPTSVENVNENPKPTEITSVEVHEQKKPAKSGH